MAHLNNQKLLTIAIPTYNRRDYLKECLDHLCGQLSDEIQLIVRDNCSDNYDFNSFILPYTEKYGITAIQNIVNIGADASVARIFEECNTKWLWVLGDDDYLKSNAVVTVLDFLKKYPDEVLIKFNSKYLGETVGISGFSKAMRVKFQFGCTYFISESINNVEKTKNMMFNHYKYLSLLTAHLLRVVCYLLETENEKCLFVPDEILCEHGMEITWNRMDLVDRNLMLMSLFRKQKKIFNDNIFKEIVQNSLVAVCDSPLNRRSRLSYYMEIIRKYGRLNTFKFARRQVAHVIVRELVGNSFFMK